MSWALMTWNDVQLQYEEPIIKIYTTPTAFVDRNGNQHSQKAMAKRSNEDLATVGIFPYIEANAVDRVNEVQTGFNDVFDGTTLTRTFTKTFRAVDDIKAWKVKQIQDHRDGVLYSGLISTTGSKPISTQPIDLVRYTYAALTVLQGNRTFPAGGLKLMTMDNERLSVNEAQFQTLIDDIALHTHNTDTNADTHIAAVEALSDEQQIIDYDFSTGWPANPAVT